MVRILGQRDFRQDHCRFAGYGRFNGQKHKYLFRGDENVQQNRKTILYDF